MIKKSEKQAMQNFIEDCLVISGRYNVNPCVDNTIYVAQRINVENPAEVYIVFNHHKRKISNFNNLVEKISQNSNAFLCTVFYKNDKDFMVRLGSSGKARDDKSLKKYSKKEIDRMIHLRGLEKKMLDFFPLTPLVYYQPQTARLPESVRSYDMQNVELDYSHLEVDTNQGYHSKNGISIDYKIAQELPPGKLVKQSSGFKRVSNQSRAVYLTTFKPTSTESDREAIKEFREKQEKAEWANRMYEMFNIPEDQRDQYDPYELENIILDN